MCVYVCVIEIMLACPLPCLLEPCSAFTHFKVKAALQSRCKCINVLCSSSAILE
uniref:Uncharacterized protein n=1 Tax=Octopus bimaculoides TaxID=37653 RepID=A0A0L8HE00_OCTBM